MAYDGINILTGIVPSPDSDNVNYRYNDYEIISNVFSIDHYAVYPGLPLGSKGSLKRAYNPPSIPTIGSLYRKETFPGISYANIGLSEKIQDGITAEITPRMDVTLNGVIIASAPKFTTTKTGKEKARTQAQKLRFCKAVIWGLMNDENTLKDKLSEIGYTTQAKTEIPDPVDYLIENITMSPFPGPAFLDIMPYDQYVVDTLTKEIDDEGPESIYDITGSFLDADNNPETADQIINAFCTIPPGRYYPHLKVYIQEITA